MHDTEWGVKSITISASSHRHTGAMVQIASLGAVHRLGLLASAHQIIRVYFVLLVGY